jgi:hypothetical protein
MHQVVDLIPSTRKTKQKPQQNQTSFLRHPKENSPGVGVWLDVRIRMGKVKGRF